MLTTPANTGTALRCKVPAETSFTVVRTPCSKLWQRTRLSVTGESPATYSVIPIDPGCVSLGVGGVLFFSPAVTSKWCKRCYLCTCALFNAFHLDHLTWFFSCSDPFTSHCTLKNTNSPNGNLCCLQLLERLTARCVVQWQWSNASVGDTHYDESGTHYFLLTTGTTMMRITATL